MKKWIVLVGLVLFVLPIAQAGIGVFGTYWDSKDYDDLYGGGVRLGTPIGAGFGIEARASYLSTDLYGDDDVALDVVPLEAVLSWTLDASDMLKPYVGAGVNYTIFFNEKAKGGFTDFDLKDSFGFALQAGFDYMIDRHWGFNFDVKKIFLEPKVKVNNGLVAGKVKIDPWLIGAGVTYRF